MTLEELAVQAIESINETPKPFEAKLTLIMPGVWRKSNKKRLMPKGKCPIGSIVQETNNGLTVLFDAVDILAFCIANGVEIKTGIVIIP